MTRLSFLIRREWLSLIFAGVFVTLLLNALLAPQSPRDLVALRAHRAALETRRDQLTAENAVFRTNVQRLRSDNHYIESMIRHDLGYARSDELVYKFTGDAYSSQPAH